MDRSIAGVSKLSYNDDNNDDDANDNIGDAPAGPIPLIDRSMASVHCPNGEAYNNNDDNDNDNNIGAHLMTMDRWRQSIVHQSVNA